MSTACITPFIKKETNQPLPCGKCPGCVIRRVCGWSFRLMQHEKISKSAMFVTLTYNTDHVPIKTDSAYPMTLVKKDLQDFFKRLRKRSFIEIKIGKRKHKVYERISYYAAGEYGSKSYRPHYHIILFGATVQAVIDAWKKDGKEIGTIHIGQVTSASIGYTLKYISKPTRVPVCRTDTRQPEFALMSKGLGKNYINEKTLMWHKMDLNNRMYLPLENGKKCPMPRYYKEKIYSKEQQGWLKGIMESIAFERDWLNSLDPDYKWNKLQADKAAFKKMHKSSTKNDSI